MADTCGTCGAATAAAARFCTECGSALQPATCPGCGADRGTGRFCAHCGTSLTPDLESLRSPARVAERRVTSVLFGDLVGFTALSESRDPEEVRELLSQYFREARTVVGRYGGTVEKFIGDAVMAVWGVPVAQEDDAERAVRAGLDLVSVVAALGLEVGAPGLALRVGVVTGEVAVTLGATGEGMVAGDAVNTAARVQSLAPPGKVWVDEATRWLTASVVAFDDSGVHELKGKAKPMALFQARMVVAAAGSVQRVDGLEAPFTGRERQLRLVKELCHETAEEGRPRLVLIEGVAGVGKSRLAWEFEKYIDGLADVFAWHRGRCLSYGDAVAFWALTEVVRTRLGLAEGDPVSVVERHLAERLSDFIPDEVEQAWVRPRLGALLGVGGAAGYPREDLFAAWTRFLESAGNGSPVIVVLEDLHHADDGLLDFLDHLLATARHPVHVVALARPELLDRRPALASSRRVTTLHLEALGDAAMGALVDGLVDGLPEASRAALVSRADGIPLYAVETVRALIDRDAVVPRGGRYVLAPDADVTVALDALGAPASLQALIASRLDALAPAERRLIADASVLGLAFSRAGLESLVSASADLDQLLESLVRRELLAVQTDRFSADRGQYHFVQAVVRQVAYDTLSRRDRKAGHLAAAAHLAADEAAEDLSALIAQHYLDAAAASSSTDGDTDELTARAVTLLDLAARRAMNVASPSEALRHYELALAHSRDPDQVVALHDGAAAAAYGAGRYRSAIDHAAEVLAAREPHNPVGAGAAAAFAGRSLMALGDPRGAVDLLAPRWAAVAEDPATSPTALQMLNAMALSSHLMADADAALEYAERSLLLAEELTDQSMLVDVLITRAIVWLFRGARTASLALLRAAADMARAGRLNAELVRALSNTVASLLGYDVQPAMAAAREAFEVSALAGSQDRRTNAAVNLAIGLLLVGEWQELASLLEQLADEAPSSQSGTFAALWLVWEGATGARTVDPAVAMRNLDSDDLNIKAWALRAAVVLDGREGDLAAAAAHGRASVDAARFASGLSDDFPYVWVPAVLAALDNADLALTDELLLHVQQAPAGLVSPLLRAQLLRLEGRRAWLAGGDPEPLLRAGVAALGAFGAVPDQARAQAELGSWLLSQGRADEAAVLLADARRTYRSLGAGAWLAELEAQPSDLST